VRSQAARADALWGAAIAWFHAGEFDKCLAALDAIEAEWGGKPSAEFSAIREYVQAASGEAAEDAMPPVLKDFAPYPEEKKRTRGSPPPSP
jgi:hypothetical protein